MIARRWIAIDRELLKWEVRRHLLTPILKPQITALNQELVDQEINFGLSLFFLLFGDCGRFDRPFSSMT